MKQALFLNLGGNANGNNRLKSYSRVGVRNCKKFIAFDPAILLLSNQPLK